MSTFPSAQRGDAPCRYIPSLLSAPPVIVPASLTARSFPASGAGRDPGSASVIRSVVTGGVRRREGEKRAPGNNPEGVWLFWVRFGFGPSGVRNKNKRAFEANRAWRRSRMCEKGHKGSLSGGPLRLFFSVEPYQERAAGLLRPFAFHARQQISPQIKGIRLTCALTCSSGNNHRRLVLLATAKGGLELNRRSS